MTHPLVGAYTYAEFFSCAVGFLPVMAFSHLRHRGDPTHRVPGRWMRRFGRATSGLTPVWRFDVEGEPPPDIRERAYVVVANHESTADPFLLSHLPWDMRWVAKEEIFRLPLLGWMMRLCGDIPIRRGRRDSIEEMMRACRETLESGLPVMLFPEGTRSEDGTLLPFRDGAFRLAIRAGVPVLPLAIAGTRDCRPKGSLWFGSARARVRILEPVATTGLGTRDTHRLKMHVRGAIETALPGLRARAGLTPTVIAGPSSLSTVSAVGRPTQIRPGGAVRGASSSERVAHESEIL